MFPFSKTSRSVFAPKHGTVTAAMLTLSKHGMRMTNQDPATRFFSMPKNTVLSAKREALLVHDLESSGFTISDSGTGYLWLKNADGTVGVHIDTGGRGEITRIARVDTVAPGAKVSKSMTQTFLHRLLCRSCGYTRHVGEGEKERIRRELDKNTFLICPRCKRKTLDRM